MGFVVLSNFFLGAWLIYGLCCLGSRVAEVGLREEWCKVMVHSWIWWGFGVLETSDDCNADDADDAVE